MNKMIKIQQKNIIEMTAKDIYKLIITQDNEIPVGFSKWIRCLDDEELKYRAKYILKFIHHSIATMLHVT